MDQLASSEFRKAYGRLTEPTEVTVNGHVIGTWVPASDIMACPAEMLIHDKVLRNTPGGRAESAEARRSRQQVIDATLAKINRTAKKA